MIDTIFAQLRALGDGWTREAAHRRQISAVDPVADAMMHCATELQDQLRELQGDLSHLSVEDYARMQHVTPQTVRAWIRAGELEAVRTDAGAWRIPKTARRRKSA